MKITRYTCSPEQFRAIATHPLLAPSLRLARSVNALRSLQTAAVPTAALPRRLKVRQQQNILLYLGATLYEALEVLNHLGPELGRLPCTQQHLAPLRRARDWRAFKENILWPLRRSVVFHFDGDVLPPSFPELKFDPTVFLSRGTGVSEGTFYELADYALVPAAFAHGDYPNFFHNYARYLNDAIVYTAYFCRAADAVLEDVAIRLGFVEVGFTEIFD